MAQVRTTGLRGYFAGWGAEAGEFAGRMKQPLKLWVLWPR